MKRFLSFSLLPMALFAFSVALMVALILVRVQ